MALNTLGGIMKKSSVEVSVGIFVILGMICVGYVIVNLGGLGLVDKDYYYLKASFDDVTGLKVGANVEMAGVQVGTVESLELDPERLVAVTVLKIRDSLVLSDDVIASVKTSGIIGDKFIKLSPGGSDEILRSGDVITDTESALDLEDLISKYVFGSVE